MDVEKIADILLNLSLDMDYEDYIENRNDYDKAVAGLKREIENLNKTSCLYNVLENIAETNEKMFQMLQPFK